MDYFLFLLPTSLFIPRRSARQQSEGRIIRTRRANDDNHMKYRNGRRNNYHNPVSCKLFYWLLGLAVQKLTALQVSSEGSERERVSGSLKGGGVCYNSGGGVALRVE